MPLVPNPALLIKPVHRAEIGAQRAHQRRDLPQSDRSQARNSIAPRPSCGAWRAAAVELRAHLAGDGDDAIAGGRERAAIASPSPRLPPVTMTLRTGAHQLAGGGSAPARARSAAGPAPCGRPGVRRHALSRSLLMLVGLAASAPRSRRPSSTTSATTRAPVMRIAPRLDQRHAHARIGVEHRLDFLRVDLQSPDVDDAALAAAKIVAAVLRARPDRRCRRSHHRSRGGACASPR